MSALEQLLELRNRKTGVVTTHGIAEIVENFAAENYEGTPEFRDSFKCGVLLQLCSDLLNERTTNE